MATIRLTAKEAAQMPQLKMAKRNRPAKKEKELPYPGFENECRKRGIPIPLREQPVCEGRRWKMDFYWPIYSVVVEVEGGVWQQGRHTRGAGYIADCEKYNEISLRGLTLIRVTPKDLETGKVFDWLRRAGL